MMNDRMLSMSGTTTHHQSYHHRIMNSCKSICLAPVFLIIGITILISNEGNLINQSKTLQEGLKLVVNVKDPATTKTKLLSSYEGKLIHITGKLTTPRRDNENSDGESSSSTSSSTMTLSDPILGVTVDNCIKLKRTVKMYQWVEESTTTSSKDNTTTSYRYPKQWRDHLINSNSFYDLAGHENPETMMFFKKEFVAGNNSISIGGNNNFLLADDVIEEKLNWYQPISSTSISVDTIHDETLRREALIWENGFFFGSSSSEPSSPWIGDTHVTFSYVESQTVSVIGLFESNKNNNNNNNDNNDESNNNAGGTISTYAKSDKDILLIERGAVDAKTMFRHAQETVIKHTWVWRLVGYVIILLSFLIMIQPITAMASIIPLAGELVEIGTIFFTMILSSIVSIVTISLSWLWYRPLISIMLLLCMVGILYIVKRYKNKVFATTGNNIFGLYEAVDRGDNTLQLQEQSPQETAYEMLNSDYY